MATIALQATKRTVFGKRVKRLRQAGLVPANIYGHGRPSEAVQLLGRDLEAAARAAGSSGMVELRVDGEQGARNVIIRRVTRHVVTRRPVHADLYHVRMDEPIVAEVPIHLVGEAPAVKDENGNVLPLLTHIRVRALPGALPSAIVVDISGLAHVDDAIAVRDLPLPAGVESLLDPDELVTKVNAPRLVVEAPAPAVVPEAAPPAAE